MARLGLHLVSSIGLSVALAACTPPRTAHPGEDSVGDEGQACGGEPLTVTFLDAGQALAAIVTLPDGRHIMVDTGESPTRPTCGPACKDWNARVVSGAGRVLHGDPISMLWITHQHSDHHGGLPTLTSAGGLQIEHYVDNGTREDQGGVTSARAGATHAGAQLHVVAPGAAAVPIPGTEEVDIEAIVPSAWPASCTNNPNECSIGLLVTYCESSVLFTGDAEHKAEAVWPVGDVSLLQVGHHGSDTSSELPFIDEVSPEYAVISSGKRDEGTNVTYCHPIKSTVDRLTAATGGPGSRSAVVYDTSEHNCKEQTDADWVPVALSDNLWLTSEHGHVVLQTTGDGVFTRVVNVNLATKEELESLPGIGEVKAIAILQYREDHGPFTSLEALDDVPGIGPATIAGLAGKATA